MPRHHVFSFFCSTCWGGVLFPEGPLSKAPFIAKLQHSPRRIWTCAEPEFRLWWLKLIGSDNHQTVVQSYKFWGMDFEEFYFLKLHHILEITPYKREGCENSKTWKVFWNIFLHFHLFFLFIFFYCTWRCKCRLGPHSIFSGVSSKVK